MSTLSNGNSINITLLNSNLAGAADPTPHIFDGSPEITTGYTSVHVTVNASRNGTVYAKHSIDGVKWDIVDSFDYPGSVTLGEGLYFYLPIKGHYYKTEFHNTHSGSNNIRLQTFLRSDMALMDVSLKDQPISVTISGGGGSGGTIANFENTVSTENSSSTPLSANGEFTGSFTDCLNHADIGLSIYASHDSASNGLIIEYSSDSTNVDTQLNFSITGGVGKIYNFGTHSRYMRVRYVNGSTSQSSFRLQTLLKRVRSKPSSHRIGDAVSIEDDAELVKSVLMGELGGTGGTTNIKASSAGELNVVSTQGTSPWTVTNNDLAFTGSDLRVVFANDTIDVTGLTFSGDYLQVSAQEPLTVEQANPDNLLTTVHGSDGTSARKLKTDSAGKLEIKSIEDPLTLTTNFSYDEDSGHVSGAKGALILAVRSDAPASLADADFDYTPLQVNNEGYLRISTFPSSEVSDSNSTESTLLAGETFTGDWIDVIDFADVALTVRTSHDSVTDGLIVEHSTNGTDIDAIDRFTIRADDGSQYSFGVSSKYMRVSYTNGSSDQTFFRLQTLLKRVRGKSSSHRVDEDITLQHDAELVRAVIMGETTAGGGGTVNVKVNPSGTLQCNVEQENATSLQTLNHGTSDGGTTTVPLLTDSDGRLETITKSQHTRVWNNELVAPGAESTAVNIDKYKFIDIYGAVSGGSTNITMHVSFDATTWYSTDHVITTGGDYYANMQISAPYVRATVSDAVTITLIFSGK